MDNFFELLSNNPTYLIIAVVFSVIILFSVAKKLLKITLVAISIFILWTAYTIWSGQELTQEELKDRIIETSEKLKENTVKKVQEKTQEEINAEAERKAKAKGGPSIGFSKLRAKLTDMRHLCMGTSVH